MQKLNDLYRDHYPGCVQVSWSFQAEFGHNAYQPLVVVLSTDLNQGRIQDFWIEGSN